MKKITSFLLTACTLWSLAVCASGCKPESEPEPVYTSTEKLKIGMWEGISDKLVTYDQFTGEELSSRELTEEEFIEKYQEIADAGFTFALPGLYTFSGTEEYNKFALKAAYTVGIKQMVSIPAMISYLMEAKTLYDAGELTKETAVETVKEYLRPYREYEYGEALYGIIIDDEPDASKFDALGFAQEIFSDAAPDLVFYTNLFPVIASNTTLGNVNYDTYINDYLDKVKTPYINYDHYPLLGKGTSTWLEETFLQNMEIVRKKIDEEEKDREMWTFLQSISYDRTNRALKSVGDATFQMYSFLAYGGDCVQWFCYSPPPGASFGNDALVDRNYNKTPAYDYVKTANEYAQAMMPWYKNFKWKGTMTTSSHGGEGNFALISKLSSTKTLRAFKGTADGLAGVLEDKDGREGYMVVNFTDPGKNIDNTVTLTVKGVHNAIVVLNGEKKIVPVNNGKIVLELKSGEGCFVIPY